MEDQANMNMPEEKNSSAGPLIGIILILAVIALGAYFFWGENSGEQALQEEINQIETQSDSDETADIEADLNSTEIDDLDSELEAEFNAS